MQIHGPETSSDGTRVTFAVETPSQTIPITFSSEHGGLEGQAEVAVTASLLAAMKAGAPLKASGPISAQYLAATEIIQDIFQVWLKGFQRTSIEGLMPEQRPAPERGRIGTFFSGGVDSFYTFLKHQEEITDLIFVHGFDLALSNHALRQEVSTMLRQVAADTGKRLIEVATDLRVLLDEQAPWQMTHGTALATVGHLLAGSFRRIYVPATHTYANLAPLGSHPILDPLWSTEGLAFVHDGCEASRIAKIDRLATSDLALRSLRVCWENREGAYNCGTCEKCLRTMLSLYAAGVLDRCTTFDKPLTPERVRTMTFTTHTKRFHALDNLRALEERQLDPALIRALRQALGEPSWANRAWKHLRWRYRQLNRSMAQARTS